MSEVTVTSKGQTTIPKDIRDSLGLEAGHRLTFTLMPDGSVVLRAKNQTVMRSAGKLRDARRRPRPIEELSR